MVGLYLPTEIDDLADEITERLLVFSDEAGINKSAIIELAADIKDILNDHLYNGGV